MEELEELCKPLVDFLKEHYDLHTSIIISQDYIRLVRDEIGIPLEVKD